TAEGNRGTRETCGRREGKPFPFFSACSASSAVQFACGKSSQLASNLDYCSAERAKSQLLFVMAWLCVLCVLLRPILDPRSVLLRKYWTTSPISRAKISGPVWRMPPPSCKPRKL